MDPLGFSNLRTIGDILAGRPATLAQHEAELACGWVGSDGCSYATDTILRVLVGEIGTAFRPELPCYAHDLDYRTIRRELAWGAIDHLAGLEAKVAADRAFLASMLRVIALAVPRLLQPLARWRAHRRFDAVHCFGFTSAMPLDEREVFVRPAPRSAEVA